MIRQIAELFGLAKNTIPVEDHGFFLLITSEDHSLILVRPEIDSTSREQIDSAVNRIDKLGISVCIIDISQLDDVSSDVMTALVRVWKRLSESGGDMALVTRNERSLAVLEAAQLASIWNIADTHDSAADLLGISKAVRLEARERRILVIVAPWAVLTAILIIALESIPGIETQAVLPGISFLLCGLAVACGGLSTVRETGFRRIASAVVSVVAVLLATGIGLHRWYPETYWDLGQTFGLKPGLIGESSDEQSTTGVGGASPSKRNERDTGGSKASEIRHDGSKTVESPDAPKESLLDAASDLEHSANGSPAIPELIKNKSLK